MSAKKVLQSRTHALAGIPMAVRTAPLLVLIAVTVAMSCNKTAKPPGPSSSTGPRVPSCSAEATPEVQLTDGTELRVWNLKASELKQLTCRLLVITDGKVQTANEVEYRWENWEPSALPVTGQLAVLIQDGKAFGVQGKRLPSMTLDFKNSPPYTRIEKPTKLMLEGELHPEMGSTLTRTNQLGEWTAIYVRVFTPTPNTSKAYSLGDREGLVKASKGGRTVVAVELEWAGR
jgi:hypothetical protein